MTSEKQRPADFGAAISRSVRAWLHRFRSLHGSPYALAVEVDEACLVMRAVASTEAHCRQTMSEINDPKERARRRWSIEHWVETEQGPDFQRLSAILRNQAWQPSFESFRAMALESMLLGMQAAATRGAFGPRHKRSTICLFLSTTDPSLKIDLQRTSAQELNLFGEAKDFLQYLEAARTQ